MDTKELEEVAKNYIESKNPQWTPYHSQSFIDGAKWQAEKMYSKKELLDIILVSCEEGMKIQRTINETVNIPATRIKNFQNKVIDNYRK